MFLSIINRLRMSTKHLVVKSEYERIVAGEVYVPGQEDAHGNIMTADEIKKACYNFMKNKRTYNIDLMHNNSPTGDYLVEIFIARPNDPDGFIEGAWVAFTKIDSDEIWNKILKGEINCYSLAGLTTLDRKVETVERVVDVKGKTKENLDEMVPSHSHPFHIKFDDDNQVIPTNTGMSAGHSHPILAGSSTEEKFGHSHRYTLEGK